MLGTSCFLPSSSWWLALVGGSHAPCPSIRGWGRVSANVNHTRVHRALARAPHTKRSRPTPSAAPRRTASSAASSPEKGARKLGRTIRMLCVASRFARDALSIWRGGFWVLEIIRQCEPLFTRRFGGDSHTVPHRQVGRGLSRPRSLVSGPGVCVK